jgi:hypothetical protein
VSWRIWTLRTRVQTARQEGEKKCERFTRRPVTSNTVPLLVLVPLVPRHQKGETVVKRKKISIQYPWAPGELDCWLRAKGLVKRFHDHKVPTGDY